MKTIFYAKISRNSKNEGYTIEIPGFPVDVAPTKPVFVSTKAEGIQVATELLEGIFQDCISNSEPIPRQTVNNTAGLEPIVIDEYLAFVLWLRLERAKRNLSQIQAAKLLSISGQNYQRLELPKLCNPTMRTMIKIRDAFGLDTINI